MSANAQPVWCRFGRTEAYAFPRSCGSVACHADALHFCEGTFREYELNIRTLSKFFGETKLAGIDADKIREYRRARIQQHCA